MVRNTLKMDNTHIVHPIIISHYEIFEDLQTPFQKRKYRKFQLKFFVCKAHKLFDECLYIFKETSSNFLNEKLLSNT